eukprot:3256336-Pyramimonas_sp.AAC.1
MSAERMPLPLDGDMKVLFERGKCDVLKYRQKAAKRGASPPWGAPVEVIWAKVSPAVNLGDPALLSGKLERIPAAEQREDDEDAAMHSSLH